MAVEQLPPIRIDQHNILIDGFHTLKAHQLVGKKFVKVNIIQVKSEKELKQLAYKFNSNHGFQLTNKEKKKYAVEMIDEISIKELSDILSVSETTLGDWTKARRKVIEEYLHRKILEEYLHAWNTQETIANMFDMPRTTVSDILKKFSENTEIGKIGEILEKPFLYNIWRLLKGNETEHFGSFPRMYMNNLLYYPDYTWCYLDPTWDIPFGSTPDWLQDYIDIGSISWNIHSTAFCDIDGNIQENIGLTCVMPT